MKRNSMTRDAKRKYLYVLIKAVSLSNLVGHGFGSWRLEDLHGGGGEVGVLVLEFTIERQAALVPVVRQQRRHVVDLAEARLTRLNREALSTTNNI